MRQDLDLILLDLWFDYAMKLSLARYRCDEGETNWLIPLVETSKIAYDHAISLKR